MLHEMNQMPDVHTLNVNDNFNGAQNNRGVDSDFSVMPDTTWSIQASPLCPTTT